MSQYLRFILDSDNDDHYTDSLIKLQSAPYVWYRLRRDGLARNILFLRVREDDQLVFHVYDEGSRQHLMQFAKARPSIFWKKEPSIEPDDQKDYPLQSLSLDEDDVLYKLLRADGRAALVFTHAAFDRICRKAGKKSIDLLTDLLNDKICNFPIYIRLPFQAEELEKCLFPETAHCALLREAYRPLLSISGDRPEPLLKAMSDVLGPQLLRLDAQMDDIFYLLLQMSMNDPNAPDSLEELGDQAEYLQLCRMLRIRLLKPPSETERYTPVTLRELAAMLQNPESRDKVRQAVRELRTDYPCGSIHTALSQKMGLPDPLPVPAYRNELALSLYIPDDCVSKLERSAILDRAKRNLITLWSKPRNPQVLEITLDLCNRARTAIHTKNWNTLNEVLIQLDFFSSQICAPAERNAALDHIREYGKMLLDLCDMLHQRHSFSDLSGLDEIIDSSKTKTHQLTADRLRAYIRRTILYFDSPKLSVTDVIKQMEEDWSTTQKDIQALETLTAGMEQQNQWQVPPLSHDKDDPVGAAASTRDFVSADRNTPDIPPLDPDRYLEDHFYNSEPDFD